MSQETIRAAERAAGQVKTMSTYDPDSDQLHEECGIFGVWAPDRDVARLTYFGLRALQHRGQESAGIAVGDGGTVMVRKDLGLLDRVFSNADLSTLSGQLAVGHVRYGTAGAKSWEASQPHLSTINSVIIALAHNGTLVNTDELRRQLIELGVPFPRNRYGEYIGYKTDHDSLRRATSVGPYTSKQMTECLERAVLAKGVPILDKTQLIKILADSGTVCGLLCLNTAAQDAADRFTLIRCKNVIWATGGPAGMYADSVYPFSQYGATGLALEAGARGKNLTEWQYGLASVAPRVYSTAADGSDEREFLMDFFSDVHDMLSNLFLKGYQWPFDVRKIADGSSIIDILVYLETCKGRKVYLDYRTNPAGGEFSYDDLLPEAREYLTRADTGNVRALWQHAVEEMSRCGAAIRDPAQIRAYGKQVEAQLADFAQTVKAGSRTELAMLYRLRDMLLSQRAYLTAMADYTAHGGKSRGSALYTDLTGGVKPFA